LHAVAEWLRQQQVKSVALESTGNPDGCAATAAGAGPQDGHAGLPADSAIVQLRFIARLPKEAII
jgi:hypothetical protein